MTWNNDGDRLPAEYSRLVSGMSTHDLKSLEHQLVLVNPGIGRILQETALWDVCKSRNGLTEFATRGD